MGTRRLVTISARSLSRMESHRLSSAWRVALSTWFEKVGLRLMLEYQLLTKSRSIMPSRPSTASETRGDSGAMGVGVYDCRWRSACTSDRHALGPRKAAVCGREMRSLGRLETRTRAAKRTMRVAKEPATKAWPAQRRTGSQLAAAPQAMKAASPARAASLRLRAIARMLTSNKTFLSGDGVSSWL